MWSLWICGGANSPLLVSIDSQGGVRRLCLASWHLCAHVVHGPTLKQQVCRCGFGYALAPYSISISIWGLLSILQSSEVSLELCCSMIGADALRASNDHKEHRPNPRGGWVHKLPKYDPPQCNTIRHADLYIPKVLFDPKTFVYLWKLFIWNFVLS